MKHITEYLCLSPVTPKLPLGLCGGEGDSSRFPASDIETTRRNLFLLEQFENRPSSMNGIWTIDLPNQNIKVQAETFNQAVFLVVETLEKRGLV